jgi:hypothetical protein
VTAATPDNSVYAGFHSRGLEGPLSHTDGYLVWVVEESEAGRPIIVKWIKEYPSRFIMGMKLNMYFGGSVGSGREYLGPLGMQWYPRSKVPWQVVETFIGCRTNEATGLTRGTYRHASLRAPTGFSYLSGHRSGPTDYGG